jgi:hypothetical protein
MVLLTIFMGEYLFYLFIYQCLMYHLTLLLADRP